MIEEGIRSLAIADPIVSGLMADRFYPFNLPDPPITPAVTYRVASTTEQYTMDGPLELIQVRLQLDSWGSTYKNAKALSVALRALLNDYADILPNGCQVFSITRDGEQSGFDEYVELPYVQTDWLILFTE